MMKVRKREFKQVIRILMVLCIVMGTLGVQGVWGIQLKQVFTGEDWQRPVFLTHAGDGSGRLFVVEQSGVIKVVLAADSQKPKVETFLNLKERVRSWGNEEGLLSVAFHPNFKQNRRLFVYYSAADPRRSVISEFHAPQDSNTAELASEKVILEVKQPYSNHNGGQLAFGLDGLLYISLGDGGSAGDPLGHGQNPRTLLGSILRIDVDSQQPPLNYAIPKDNPFVLNERIGRSEIYAYGLRNVWRFSFDAVTGLLYAADVGQNKYEEINIISKGGNYGWNVMEAKHCYEPRFNCKVQGLIEPIVEYDHQQGYSVTGGYVYRGKDIEELQGVYVYGDYGSGLIWGLRYEQGRVAHQQLLMKSGVQISSFGVDEQGELYVLGLKGEVYRLFK